MFKNPFYKIKISSFSLGLLSYANCFTPAALKDCPDLSEPDVQLEMLEFLLSSCLAQTVRTKSRLHFIRLKLRSEGKAFACLEYQTDFSPEMVQM